MSSLRARGRRRGWSASAQVSREQRAEATNKDSPRSKICQFFVFGCGRVDPRVYDVGVGTDDERVLEDIGWWRCPVFLGSGSTLPKNERIAARRWLIRLRIRPESKLQDKCFERTAALDVENTMCRVNGIGSNAGAWDAADGGGTLSESLGTGLTFPKNELRLQGAEAGCVTATWSVLKIDFQLKQVRERLAKGLVDKDVLPTEHAHQALQLERLAAEENLRPAVCLTCAAYTASVFDNAFGRLGYEEREGRLGGGEARGRGDKECRMRLGGFSPPGRTGRAARRRGGGRRTPEVCDAAGDDGMAVGRPRCGGLEGGTRRARVRCASRRAGVALVKLRSQVAGAGVEVAGRAGVQDVPSARAADCGLLWELGHCAEAVGGPAAWCLQGDGVARERASTRSLNDPRGAPAAAPGGAP
ncbi:hypothetical protein B0H14DRAFT_2638856 [Mycena olivaceomarginata]|nr:hypothetical protein B0H14DRAFT_2638856 [Mycena olivaceomarginata]